MPTQQQVELDQAVRRILADIERNGHASRSWSQAPRQLDRAAWRALAEMGLLGLGVSESHGGSGAELSDWARVAKRCGATLTGCPVVPAAPPAQRPCAPRTTAFSSMAASASPGSTPRTSTSSMRSPGNSSSARPTTSCTRLPT
jgi:hypothetical protein